MNNDFSKLNAVSAKKVIYFFAMSLWIMQSYLANSYYSMDYGYGWIFAIKVFAIFLFVMDFLLFSRKFKLKLLVGLVLFSGILFMAVYTSGTLHSSSNFIITLLIILCSKDIVFKDICKLCFWNELLWGIFIMLSAKIGIITDYISVYQGRRRDCLGATFPGFFPVYFVNLFFCGLYVYGANKKDMKKYWYILLFLPLASLFLYKMTDIRLTFGITMLGFVFYIIIMMIGEKLVKSKIIKYISMMTYPLFAIITYVLSFRFNWNDITMWELNQLLSGRLQYNKQALDKYGVHLFGGQVEYNMGTISNNYSDYFFIDSGYMEIGIRYGMVLLIILISIYIFLIKRAVEKKNVILFLWLILLSAYNMINNMMFSVTTNVTILAFWELMNNLKTKTSKENIICKE